MMKVTNLEQYECSCYLCKSMCDRPCWPTPEEAERLMESPFGDSLMLDYWVGNFSDDEGDVEIICPALVGYENQKAPFWPTGDCMFQDKDGLCVLHTAGLKPLEARVTGCKSDLNVHKEIARLWDSEKGRQVVSRWLEQHYPPRKV